MTYRTANLQSCILYIYSTNRGTEYFKHGLYSPFFSLQNAVFFIILTYLVPVLFTFYIQGVLKLKKNNSGAKTLKIPLRLVYVFVNVQSKNVNNVNGMSDSLHSLTSLAAIETRFDTFDSPKPHCLSVLI